MGFATVRSLLAKNGRKFQTISALCLFLTMMFCQPAFSQTEQGRLYGAITDQTGGALAGATVTVTDVARGGSRSLMTDAAGEYNAPNLLPGIYTVRAEAKGFGAIERQNVQVDVGGELRVDLTLQPGEQTQTVVVTEALPMINTTNATLGGALQTNEVVDLPINGRDYQTLEDFRPGVLAKPGGGPLSRSTNGIQGKATAYMLEGQWNKAVYGATGIIGGTNNIGEGATSINLDAIQEFTLIENPKAEYGWAAGVVLNIGLKAGTNDMHGSAYAFGRDGGVDARNPFTPGQPEILARQLFGAVLGGPIKKDKLFYFIAYEGDRISSAQAGVDQAPTTASLGSVTNSIPDAIAAMNDAGHFVSTLSERILGCNPTTVAGIETANGAATTGPEVAAACNAANSLYGNGSNGINVAGSTPISRNGNNYIGKLNYQLNDHHAMMGEYLHGESNTLLNTAFTLQPYESRLNPIVATEAQVSETWSPSSTWVNEARFGWHLYDQHVFIGECSENFGQPNYLGTYGLNTGSLAATCGPNHFGAMPAFTVTGFTALGCTAAATCDPEPRVEHTSQLSDSVSYTRGKHLFKFGGEYRHSSSAGFSQTSIEGAIGFGSATVTPFSGATPLESLLAGDASTSSYLVGNTTGTVEAQFIGGFIQDDWRILPRVTLNLGLRYEFSSPIRALNNTLGGFIPTSPAGIYQPGVTPGQPNQLFTPTYDDIQPRIGVAWDVTGKGDWVIRSGFGAFPNIISYQSYFAQAAIQTVPTGANLYLANGALVPKPGNITAAVISVPGVSNTTGPTNTIPWIDNITTPGNPIFNTTSTLACGTGAGTQGFVNPVAGAPTKDPPPCAVSSIQPNLKQGAVYEWNLNIDHTITNNLSLDLAYVGTHSANGASLIDLNQPSLGASGAQVEQQRRPYNSNCASTTTGGLGTNPAECFPYLSAIGEVASIFESNYNAFEATLTQRLSHGVSFAVGYTLSHSLTDGGSDDVAGSLTTASTENSFNPHLDYGNSDFDSRNHVSIHGSWAIPGRKAPGEMLEGWTLNSVLFLQSGLPFNATDSTDDFSGTGEKADRWTLVGQPKNFDGFGAVGQVPCYGITGSTFGKNPVCTQVGSVANLPAACVAAATGEAMNPNISATPVVPFTTTPATLAEPGNSGLLSLAKVGCYVSAGSVIVPPAQGTYGTMSRYELYGKGLHEWDASITKDWKFRERFGAQFRFEAYNVLNRTQYASPSSGLATANTFAQAQATGNNGNGFNGNGGPRSFQFGLKLSF